MTSVEVLRPNRIGGLQVVKAQARQPYVNILVYGDPGVGKTRLAGSADAVPTMRKVLFVDLEAGTLTLTHSYPDVDIVRVSNWDEMQAVYDELLAGNHDYTTVVLDSLTEIQKFNMAQVMRDRLANSSADLDPDIPDMRAWGKNIEQIRRFIRAFRDLPMHTIFTALLKTEKNKRNGLTEHKPYLSGKLADEVAGFLDIVCYLYVKEVEGEQKRLLLTGATDEITAKDRTGKLDVVMVDPTMGDILNAIQTKPNLSESEPTQ